MAQNRSHAVMAQRHESADSRDDFPTPPWATRAFLHHAGIEGRSVWEPACNRGYMSRVLQERFDWVYSSDIERYTPDHAVIDFLGADSVAAFEWVITNPPFRLAQEFMWQAMRIATKGVALLTRTVFIEGAGRYQTVFAHRRPNYVYQYAERVPMVKGRYDPNASTATAYCWLVWLIDQPAEETILRWVPPCKRQFERVGDNVYEENICVVG